MKSKLSNLFGRLKKIILHDEPKPENNMYKECPECDGTGLEDVFQKCETCQGTGTVRKTYQEYVESLPNN